MMKSKTGFFLMMAGTLFIIAAASMICLNLIEEKRADIYSEQTAEVLHSQIPDYKAYDNGSKKADIPEENLTNESTPEEMQVITIDSREYIGVLDIPSLGLSLPIMKNWSYPNLKLAPCRYSGSFLDNSMVIAGHNYKKHFGLLYKLQCGDLIIFTDVTGKVYQYEVSSVETLSATAVNELKSGDWNLTLFTCTPGGSTRVVVRCKLYDNK